MTRTAQVKKPAVKLKRKILSAKRKRRLAVSWKKMRVA
jgi:hypothetical protein